MKKRKNSPIWKDTKRRRSWNRLDKETSRLSHSSTISSEPEKNKSKNAGYSFKTKRKNTLKTWKSRLKCTTRNWRKLLSLVLNRRKRENKNITNAKDKLRKERDKSKSNKDSKQYKRKRQSNANKRKEDKYVKIIKSKWKSTSLISRRSFNQKKKIWLEFSVKSSKKCCKNTMKKSLNALTRNKMSNASWKFKNIKSKN